MTTSLIQKVEEIINDVNRSKHERYIKAAADVENLRGEKSRHPTAEADDSTVTPETGEQEEFLSEYMEENVPGSPDTHDELESNADLPPIEEGLTGLDPAVAGSEAPFEVDYSPEDDTEHPADASKQAFIRRVKRASLSQLFKEAAALVRHLEWETSRWPAAESQLLHAIKSAAEETADMVAGAEAADAQQQQEPASPEEAELRQNVQELAQLLQGLSPEEAAQVVAQAVAEFLQEHPDRLTELLAVLDEQGVALAQKQAAAEAATAAESMQELADILKDCSPEEAGQVLAEAVEEFLEENPDKIEAFVAALDANVQHFREKLQELLDLLEGLSPEESGEVVAEAVAQVLEENPKELHDLVSGLEEQAPVVGPEASPEDVEKLQELAGMLEGLSPEEAGQVIADAMEDFLKDHPEELQQLEEGLAAQGIDVKKKVAEAAAVEGQPEEADPLAALTKLPADKAARVVGQAVSEFLEENPDKAEELEAVITQQLTGGEKTEEEEEEEKSKDEKIDQVAEDLLQALSGSPAPEETKKEGHVPLVVKRASNDVLADETISALIELGRTEDDLMAAGRLGRKLANALRRHRASGKYKLVEASVGSERRKIRDYMKEYLSELFRVSN